MRFIWNKLNLFFKILLISFVIIAVYIGNVVFFPQKIPNGQYKILVNKNQNLTELATILEQQNIIKNRQLFLLLLRTLHKDKKVIAGLYFLKHPISTWGLIWRLSNGKPDQISITFLDGWTFAQMRNYIDGITEIKHITTNMSESDLKVALKIDTQSLEGLFYPSTYFIAPGQTDLEIYQHAYEIMKNKLDILFSVRGTNTVYKNPYQLLIMASLIEKETNNVRDMYLISAVFNNRIRANMKLQDDPAVFYGARQQNNISGSVFRNDNQYNTYLHYGLPPTPICIPSMNALMAASKPIDNPKVFYFVAIGGGKTKFSKTYNEHLGAVGQYLKKPVLAPKSNNVVKSNKIIKNKLTSNKIIIDSGNGVTKIKHKHREKNSEFIHEEYFSGE